MDRRLIAWARAVKMRRARASMPARAKSLPVLWVFSDRARLPDPVPVLRLLPKGLCGVVLRPGGALEAGVLRRVLAVCRARRFPVVAASQSALAPAGRGAGRHFSRWVKLPRRGRSLVTASAHCRAELVRAARARVDCAFLSPAFPTLSHPGGAVLGPLRWTSLARGAGVPVFALGGVTGISVRRLPGRFCAGVGMIGAAITA